MYILVPGNVVLRKRVKYLKLSLTANMDKVLFDIPGDLLGDCQWQDWSHIPEFKSSSFSAEDNPFDAPKQQSACKISVNLSTDDWLCKKFDRLNVTLVEGYPSSPLKLVDCIVTTS